MQQIRSSLLIVWLGAAFVFGGWITGILSVTIPSGPYSYIALGPLLEFLGLIEILVGAGYIYQALSFHPASHPSTDPLPDSVGMHEFH